eukprot:scaffold30004_cov72-Phaeocystis_antarctica.AAC.3
MPPSDTLQHALAQQLRHLLRRRRHASRRSTQPRPHALRRPGLAPAHQVPQRQHLQKHVPRLDRLRHRLLRRLARRRALAQLRTRAAQQPVRLGAQQGVELLDPQHALCHLGRVLPSAQPLAVQPRAQQRGVVGANGVTSPRTLVLGDAEQLGRRRQPRLQCGCGLALLEQCERAPHNQKGGVQRRVAVTILSRPGPEPALHPPQQAVRHQLAKQLELAQREYRAEEPNRRTVYLDDVRLRAHRAALHACERAPVGIHGLDQACTCRRQVTEEEGQTEGLKAIHHGVYTQGKTLEERVMLVEVVHLNALA